MCSTLGFPWVACASKEKPLTSIGFYPEILIPNDIACGFYIALQSQVNTCNKKAISLPSSLSYSRFYVKFDI